MQTAFLGKDGKTKSYMGRLEKLVDVELRMVSSIILSTAPENRCYNKTHRGDKSAHRDEHYAHHDLFERFVCT